MSINFSVNVTMGDFAQPGQTGSPNQSTKRVQNLIEKLRAGSADGTLLIRQSLVKASGTVTLATASGTITATINGVAVSVVWATNDTLSAAALAAAINASSDALISGIVTATSALGVVTVQAVVGGKAGNAITLAASGTNATASGARLTAGAETLFTYTF